MPEWMRVSIEILNTLMIWVGLVLLLIVWCELRSHRREMEGGDRLEDVVLTDEREVWELSPDVKDDPNPHSSAGKP